MVWSFCQKLYLFNQAQDLLPRTLPSQKVPSAHTLHLLEQLEFAIEGSEDENSDSSSDSECSNDEEAGLPDVQAILLELRRKIRCLQELSTALYDLLDDTEQAEYDPSTLSIGEIAPHTYYSNCIRERFPTAPEEIVDHLGIASLKRYQKLLERRSKLYDDEEQVTTTVELVVVDRSTKSVITDSGYGSEAASIALSVVSSLGDGSRSKYPPLPEAAEKGEPFECLACGRQIVAKHKQAWR
jgi:hypothetical protein